MRRKRFTHLRRLSALALTIFLLAGIGAQMLSRPGPGDAEPYHQRVRDAVARMADRVGPWIGRDQASPPSAIELLNPNAMRARLYEHRHTGQNATLLIVHCKDARDLGGHYPPNCYPATGWVQQSAEPATWRLAGMTLTGRRYTYHRRGARGTDRITVLSLLVLPSGREVGDMPSVRRAAADYQRRFYGAAQIQLVVDARMADGERRNVFRKLLEANRHVLTALRSASLEPSNT